MKARIIYSALVAFIVIGFSVSSVFAQGTMKSSSKNKIKKTETTIQNKTNDAKTTAKATMKSDVKTTNQKTTNVASTSKSEVKAKTHKMHKHMKHMKKDSNKQKTGK